MLLQVFSDLFLVVYTMTLTLRLSNDTLFVKRKWYQSEKVDSFIRDIGYMSAGAFFTIWLIS